MNKTKQLIESWLDFLKLEDIEKAVIKSDRGLIYEGNGINIIGNRIYIFEEVYTRIQQRHVKNEKPVFVSFPVIYSTGYNKLMEMYPLFIINISDVFQLNWNEEGWDLEKFESTPVIENIAKVFALEDEEVEDLPTKEGVLALLTYILRMKNNQRANEFEDIIKYFGDKSTHVDRVKFSFVPYVFNFDGTKFTFNLKRDLEDLHKLEHCPPLAKQFLYGEIESVDNARQRFVLGRLGVPPTLSQINGIIHHANNPITVIEGPPGTGKTTLILNMMSNDIIRIYVEPDDKHQIMITSVNNKAVENVLEKLDAYGLSKYYLKLGKSEFTKDAKDKISSRIQEIKSLDESHRVDLELEEIELEINQVIDDINRFKSIEESLLVVQGKIQMGEGELSSVLFEIDRLTQDHPEISHIEIGMLPESLRNLKDIYEMTMGKRTFFSKLFFGSKVRLDLNARLKISNMGFGEVKNTIELSDLIVKVNEISIFAQNVSKVKEQGEEIKRNIERLKHEEFGLNDELKTMHDEYYFEQSHQKHVDLFYKVLKWMDLKVIKERDSVLKSLERYSLFLEKNGSPIYKSDFTNIALCFPFVTTTLNSIRNAFPLYSEIIETLIVDEAGMILPHQLVPAIYRSKTSVLVGDVKQLEPVVPLSKEMKEKFALDSFFNKGLSEHDFECYSPTQTSKATAYHVASGITRNNQKNDIGLKEHFRCVKPIADVFNEISHYDLSVKTPHVDTPFKTNLIAFNVEGSNDGLINEDEVDSTFIVVQHLLKNGYSYEQIGIITPYKRQAESLREKFKNISNSTFLNNNIGTIHTFQGAEFDVIVFSSVLSFGKRNSRIYEKPNLLNVAVSRAKALFILIGNLNILERSNKYLSILVNHMRNNGVIANLPEKSIIKLVESNVQNKIVINCEHFDVFEQAIKSAENELYVITPWIREKTAQWFLEQVKQRNDLCVYCYYGYSQDQKDVQTSVMVELKQEIEKRGGGMWDLREGGEKGVHSKILIKDNKFMVVSSWNWLSNAYTDRCNQHFKDLTERNLTIRNELGVIVEDPKAIEFVKKEYTSIQNRIGVSLK